MRVVICGAGIAGLSLAWCLERRGHEPLVVEYATQLRDRGYMMDFFGSGYDASERLGLLPDLSSIHDPVERLVLRDGDGRQRVSLSYEVLRRRLFGGRHFNFMRGDLERVLYEKLQCRRSIRFGTTVRSFEQDEETVHVRLSDGTTEVADLLVGADGVHSHVRRLAFGDDTAFVRPLGFTAAAYVVNAAPGALGVQHEFVTLTVPSRQVTLYPIRGDHVATFFLYADEPGEHPLAGSACGVLHRRYGDFGWQVPKALQQYMQASSVYLDAVSQVEMPRWSAGRVVLVGDACQCLSPLAGQGASMAITASYVLAEELGNSAGQPRQALSRYEQRLKPAIIAQQRAARRIARWFVPASAWRVTIRNAITRVSTWPVVSSVIRRRMAAQSVLRA